MQTLLNPTKLILGCGERRHDGYFGIDIEKTSATDMVFDLDRPNWPLQDNTVEEVQMIHFLEHIHNHIQLFNELYRVMRHGGRVYIRGPHARSSGAWQDPTHTRPLPEEFFQYFNKDWRARNGIFYAGYKCDFNITGISYMRHPHYENATKEVFLEDLVHKYNVATELILELTVVKE